MPVSKELEPSQWRPLGLRMHPEVRRALKMSAVLSGETMEDTLHRILVREFRDHLPESMAGREADHGDIP